MDSYEPPDPSTKPIWTSLHRFEPGPEPFGIATIQRVLNIGRQLERGNIQDRRFGRLDREIRAEQILGRRSDMNSVTLTE